MTNSTHDADGPSDGRQLDRLIHTLNTLRRDALTFEQHFATQVADAHPEYRASIRNLLHYLALRQTDVRELQACLANLGVSSLGRIEAHMLASLNSVLGVLNALKGNINVGEADAAEISFSQGQQLLVKNSQALLGPEPAQRRVRIMVTLPGESAENPALARRLIESGMNLARINCAHDNEAAWGKMVRHVSDAAKEFGKSCAVIMDLGGPKTRTGPLEHGPKVLHFKPHRNLRGQVVAPARVWLSPGGSPPPEELQADAIVPVDGNWLKGIRRGDCIRFTDARGKQRKLKVLVIYGGGCMAECKKTVFLETGTELLIRRRKHSAKRENAKTRVGELTPLNTPLILHRGDTLLLLKELKTGSAAKRDQNGLEIEPARIGCTLPEILPDIKVGEAVRFDDGKIEGVVRAILDDALRIEIVSANDDGSKLDSDKGINFPDSALHIHGLTPRDLSDLDFVARHAAIVGLSFVNEPEDIRLLQDELKNRGADHVGIVLKIETKRGFEQLPILLLTAMRTYPVGVMIARGDLAVECGWERSAEVQEEILWLCEAAHIPTIWATQVLENMAKTGLPSRAEITDAAMSQRAECVMLNKGPHITDAIATLDNILRRMQEHQSKKTPMLRSLKVSGTLAPKSW